MFTFDDSAGFSSIYEISRQAFARERGGDLRRHNNGVYVILS
jgi:hypothetical protein